MVFPRRPVRTTEETTEPPSAEAEGQSPQALEPTTNPGNVDGALPAVEMADVYRSLVANLRDKLGGTINDANADAIAQAAAQVYRREVEPRLWEEKSAHELLDSFGVPRSGAFIPYSLSDRLLLLHRNRGENPHRAQVHELLDELGVPRVDEAGQERPLEARLTLLLGSLDDAAAPPAASRRAETDEPGNGPHPGSAEAAEAGDGEDEGGRAEENDVKVDSNGVNGTVDAPDLVDALETIQRAVGPVGEAETVPAPPPPPPETSLPPDLVGLGTVLGTIQEKLVDLEQAVESLRQELRDALALLQPGVGVTFVAPTEGDVGSAEGHQEIVIRRDGEPPAGVAPDAPDTPLPPDVARSDTAAAAAAEAAPVGPDEPTRVVPPVEAAAPDVAALSTEAAVEDEVLPKRRMRRVVMLLVLVVLIGVLLAAGITAAVVLGWDQLESRIIDMVPVPLWGGPGAPPW